MDTTNLGLPEVESNDLTPEVDSESTRKFSIAFNITFCLVVAAVLYACYTVWTAPIEWGFKIDWNCFHSEITYGTCCVIGFFLQFLVKGGWMHTTTEEYIGYEDPNTGKVEKWEKNNDVLTVLFNSLLWPLIMHLALIPMAYGAAIWYSIAGIIALVGKLTPYIISLLIIVVCCWVYSIAKNKSDSDRRYVWLVASALFCFSLCGATYYAMEADFSSSSTENAISNYIIVNSNKVNLRLGPGTEYDKFTSTVSAGQELQLIGEEGEWYKVAYEGNELWINSRFVDLPLPANSIIEEIGCDTEVPTEETAPTNAITEDSKTIEQEIVAETYQSEIQNAAVTEAASIEEDAHPAVNNESSASANDMVYNTVETPPSFKGGDSAMFRWLADNIKYPPMAAEKNIQGRVVVQFVVNSDGTIGDAKVIRGVNQELDNEALRVVKSMPRWKAGSMDGKAVSSWFTLPITFKLH